MKKEPINFSDLMKIDIRIGEVIEAKKVENSNKLIELTVNMGEDYGIVTVFTGMQKFYLPQDFTGKKMLFVANLEPKKMIDKESQGMILAVDAYDKPVFVTPVEDTSAGDKVI